MQRIKGMTYRATMKLDAGGTAQQSWEIGPDLWLATKVG
jgi:hypothetical protein